MCLFSHASSSINSLMPGTEKPKRSDLLDAHLESVWLDILLVNPALWILRNARLPVYSGVTFSACGPFCPWVTSIVTC